MPRIIYTRQEAIDMIASKHCLSPCQVELQESFKDDFNRFIAQKERLEAVKILRNATGAGLLECKKLVDSAIEKRNIY